MEYDCRGCLSLEHVYGAVANKVLYSNNCHIYGGQGVEHYIQPEKCPCRCCIIKSMCDTGCAEFKDLSGKHIIG